MEICMSVTTQTWARPFHYCPTCLVYRRWLNSELTDPHVPHISGFSHGYKPHWLSYNIEILWWIEQVCGVHGWHLINDVSSSSKIHNVMNAKTIWSDIEAHTIVMYIWESILFGIVCTLFLKLDDEICGNSCHSSPALTEHIFIKWKPTLYTRRSETPGKFQADVIRRFFYMLHVG